MGGTSWTRGLRAGTIAALALGCAAAPSGPSRAPVAAQAGPAPSLWRALPAEGGGAIYLLGSVHVGTGETLELGPVVEDAWEGAEELVVEVDLSRIEVDEVLALTRRFGAIPPPETLRDRISDDTYRLLAAYADRRGAPMPLFLSLEPWLVAITLFAMELNAMGYDAEHGVDRVFLERSAGQKRIVGLETMEEQLSLLSSLPDGVQELMLRDTLVRMDEARSDTVAMIDAWERGDDEALSRVVFRSIEEDPELALFYERVLFVRNEKMAARLVELSGDGTSRFVVVGAAHMLGERGLPALLARRGFRVDAVQ